MRHSTLIRAELEKDVEGLSPAARAFFDEMERKAVLAREGDDVKLELPKGSGDLPASERAALVRALQDLKELRRLEAAEDADDQIDDQERSEGISRLRSRLLVASALISLACLLVLAGMWVREYTTPPEPEPGETVVTTPEEVARYLAANVPASEDGSEPPVFIPTGLYVESVQFRGPYNATVAGYIWQRYADDLPRDINRDVLLPEAERAWFREVYRVRQGNEEVIGWSFQATLREQFNYRKYPLDRQQIWIQLWHADFERNVYLVPDLGAYTTLDPAALPGLDWDFVVENWDVQQSFFSYRANPPNVDFGIQGYEGDRSQPSLYFNILIQRNVLSAMISRMIVPLVILIQLFVLVVVIGTNRERLEQFGVRPGAVIFTCAAFFFAVLVAHNSLRSELQAPGLVYLESLYILTYLVILAVGINSVLLVARPNLKLFREHDNMWVEVLYWPTVLLALILITYLSLR